MCGSLRVWPVRSGSPPAFEMVARGLVKTRSATCSSLAGRHVRPPASLRRAVVKQLPLRPIGLPRVRVASNGRIGNAVHHRGDAFSKRPGVTLPGELPAAAAESYPLTSCPIWTGRRFFRRQRCRTQSTRAIQIFCWMSSPLFFQP